MSFSNGFDLKNNTEELKKILPESWYMLSSKGNEFPTGHPKINGKEGVKYTFVGTLPAKFHWSDKFGDMFSEDLGRESIEIWIMPSNYSKYSFSLNFKRGKRASIIYRGKCFTAYSYLNHVILDELRFAKLVQSAQSLHWTNTPYHDPKLISWIGWKDKIKKRLTFTDSC